MKLKIGIIYLMLVVVGFLASCSKEFLDRPPLSEISTDNFYQTTEDLRLATAALYAGKPWAEWNYECYYHIGEILSGNMTLGWNADGIQLNTFSITGMNGALVKNWKGMYKIIAHCNTTINAIIQKAPASISGEDKNGAIAEAKFIRAFAYYNLVTLWGAVPIIEDNTELINSPLVYRNNAGDVYRFIVNDLKFAASNLPASDDAGRLTTWSAQGMLGKVYLTLAGLDGSGGMRNQAYLDSAKIYAGNVCKNSGLSLLPKYADLFKTQFNDNEESLFALQWVPGGEWLEGNMLQLYCTIDEIMPGAGWFGIKPTIDMYNQYTTQDSIRLKATFMLRDFYYPELNMAGGGYTYDGDAAIKKHVVGTEADNNAPTMSNTSSPEHNSLLRLADVYLIYAEAILGNNATTTDADALLYFNKVRERAGVDPVSSINDTILFKERRIELAAESHFWTDLVRLSYYNPQKAVDFLSTNPGLRRVGFSFDGDVATPDDASGILFSPATIATFTLPLPSSEVTANPLLLEPPVPYY